MAIAPTMTVKTRKPARARRPAPAPRRRRLVERALIFAGCLVMIEALAGERGVVALMRAKHEAEALTRRVMALRQENARLREEARLLESDPVTLEDEARRTLGLIKPGEKLFLIRDVTPQTAASPP